MKLRSGSIPNVNIQMRDSKRKLNICQLRNGSVRIHIKTDSINGHNSYDIDEYAIVKGTLKHKQRNQLVNTNLSAMFNMIEYNHGHEVASTLARLIAEIHYT